MKTAYRNRYNLHKLLIGAPGFNPRKREFIQPLTLDYTETQLKAMNRLVFEYGYNLQLELPF